MTNSNSNYRNIEVKGYWKDDYNNFATGKFTKDAAVGVYDGTFDDDHIFYWFDDEDKIIGEHEDFVIESFNY